MTAVRIVSILVCFLFTSFFNLGCQSPAELPEDFEDQVNSFPVVTMIQPKDGDVVSNEVTIIVTATDESGIQKVDFYINDEIAPGGSITEAPYEYVWDTTDLSDGSVNAVSVEATPNVGVALRTEEILVTVYNDTEPPGDDVIPPSVSITSPSDGEAVSGTVHITASATDNVGVEEVRFYIDDEWAEADRTAPYEFDWNTSGLSSGSSHTISTRATDTAGNYTRSTSVTVTIDGGPPPDDTTPPTVSISAPSDGAAVTGTVTIRANASDNVAIDQVDFYIDTELVKNDTTDPRSFEWDTSGLADGSTHNIYAIAIDTSENTTTSSTITVTVDHDAPPPSDTTPPTAAVTSPADGATVTGTVEIRANATDNVAVAQVDFYVDGDIVKNDTTTPYSYSWNTSGLANGSTHTIRVQAIDTSENEVTSETVTVTINVDAPPPPPPPNDETPPTVSIIEPSNSATVSGRVYVSAIASDNVAVREVVFTIDGAVVNTDRSSPFEFEWDTSGLSDGSSHTIRARAVDTSDNEATSSTVTVIVDNNISPPNDSNPPSVRITSPSDGAVVSDLVHITFSASDNVAIMDVRIYIDGELANGGVIRESPYFYNWNTFDLPNGTHTISAKATDTSNNTSLSQTLYVTLNNVCLNPDSFDEPEPHIQNDSE